MRCRVPVPVVAQGQAVLLGQGFYEVFTWEQFRGNMIAAIENEKTLMGVMLSLVMIVAGFTVFALLSMMAFTTGSSTAV